MTEHAKIYDKTYDFLFNFFLGHPVTRSVCFLLKLGSFKCKLE